MSLVKRLFGGSKNTTQAAANESASTLPSTVSYHPTLIDEYTHTHEELDMQFKAIKHAVEQGRFEHVGEALTTFQISFDGHILSENVRFYAYMEQQMRTDNENLKLIREFRTEMHSIARQTTQFVREWNRKGVDAANKEAFLKEYDAVNHVLQLRLQSEEKNLYPLYGPPQHS